MRKIAIAKDGTALSRKEKDWMFNYLDRLDDAVENGEITEEEARQELLEYEARCQMEELFDENGDPYRDFLGNPW